MSEIVRVSRPVRTKGSVVLRVAQMVRLRDVVTVAPLPAAVRRLTPRVLRRSWDRGLFAIMMALGFSVREAVPLNSLTLARPLGRVRGPGWVVTAPRNGLLVRLAIVDGGEATDVSVSLGVDSSRTVRGAVVGVVLVLLRPVLKWGLELWISALESRIAALRGR